jgi:hypothetical protein
VSSPNIIREIKSRKLHNEELHDVCLHQLLFGRSYQGDDTGFACGTCRGEEEKWMQGVVGKPEEKDHLKVIGINGRIILKLILQK